MPLTGKVGGPGAVLSQEGQRWKQAVPLGTYRRELRFCEFVETGVEEVLQAKSCFTDHRCLEFERVPGELLQGLRKKDFPVCIECGIS